LTSVAVITDVTELSSSQATCEQRYKTFSRRNLCQCRRKRRQDLKDTEIRVNYAKCLYIICPRYQCYKTWRNLYLNIKPIKV
jgi:hypothetical protein